jgi:diguanylate cyclase (GGDEF)-like protein
MAEELRTSFQQLSIKHRDIVLGKVTISLGVAALPDNGTTPAQLLAAADGALLRAKREGRDRVLIAEGPFSSSPPYLPSPALQALEMSGDVDV